MNAASLDKILQNLSHRRPVFHSEADFQHELAIWIQSAGWDVRLEVPRPIAVNQASMTAEIDLLIRKNGEWTAIELKYVKKSTHVVHGDEQFHLAGSWGTNLSRFDCWADYRRIESIVAAGHAQQGHAVFLTNVAPAWNKDVGPTRNLASMFSLHEGRTVPAGSSLNWTPATPTAGSVSAKRLPPYAPVLVSRAQACRWTDYSQLGQPGGTFRYLMLSTSGAVQ